MSLPLVSVVIPFYNEEKYLERAIESVLQQSYSPVEMILINDGSTDLSSEIARNYVKDHSNISLIDTQNLGLSSARNTGIKNCKGEFLAYLDADDAFEENAIETFVKAAIQEESDIVISKFTLHDKQGISFKEAGWRLSEQKITGIGAVAKMYNGRIASVAWAKLYRRKVFNEISFPVGLWFEDRPYVMECFLNTDRLSFVDKSLLKIFAKETSITRRVVTEKRIRDLYHIYLREIQILQDYTKDTELAYHVINHHIDVLIDSFFLIVIDNQRIQNSLKCQKIFVEYLVKFSKHYVNLDHSINAKRKIALLLLSGLRILPWKFISIFITFTFRKKYASIRLLKNS